MNNKENLLNHTRFLKINLVLNQIHTSNCSGLAILKIYVSCFNRENQTEGLCKLRQISYHISSCIFNVLSPLRKNRKNILNADRDII